MITKNAQTDQFSGVYEVCFTLSLLSAPEDGFICRTEVLGEAGNTIIAAYDLQRSDFDQERNCKKTIAYSIAHVPLVSYAVYVPEGTTIRVEDVSWRKVSK